MYILIVDDEEIVIRTLGDYLCELGHTVDFAKNGEKALIRIENSRFDLTLVDIRMPGIDGLTLLSKISDLDPELATVIITAHGNMDSAIQALKAGAVDFLLKPIKLLELDAVLGKVSRHQESNRVGKPLETIAKNLQATNDSNTSGKAFIGVSPAIQVVRRQIHQITKASCDRVLIIGETGTGKEVVAREIHFQGGSDDGPFIAVNCPSLSDTLLESELFGHVKGAFTGAGKDHAGYFELADGGTLFLDEIADTSPAMQVALLRVLETRVFRRIGSREEISVSFRLIAATNACLETLIETGKFRRDLYYRLNVFAIHLLPLRERREDIIPLAKHFLRLFTDVRGLNIDGFSKPAERLLYNYSFPGNVRELKNLVERAAILCTSRQILPGHFTLPVMTEPNSPSLVSASEADSERDYILRALAETKWNRRQTAINLNMPYSTFRYKLRKLHIN